MQLLFVSGFTFHSLIQINLMQTIYIKYQHTAISQHSQTCSKSIYRTLIQIIKDVFLASLIDSLNIIKPDDNSASYFFAVIKNVSWRILDQTLT